VPITVIAVASQKGGVRKTTAGVNPRLESFGVAMTMFDGRTKFAQEILARLEQRLPD